MGCCGGEDSKLDELDGARGRNPLEGRKKVCCTDIIFLFLFISFWGLLAYIAVYSIIHGDAKRLLFGYDTFGNTCNQQYNRPIENLSLSGLNTYGKDKVFFMSATDPLDSMQICTSTCPNETLRTAGDVKRYTERTNISLCKYGFTNDYSEKNFGKTGPCPALPIYNSFTLLFRCVPYPDKDHFNQSLLIANKFNQVFELDDLFRKVLSDVYMCWREIIALCIIALVVAFLVVLVMRFLASVVVWVIVVLAIIGSLVGTAFLWWTWFRLPSEGDKVERYHIPIISVDVKNKTTFLVFSIAATVLTVILLLILLVMRKRIALVVALFHEAGKCLIDIPLLLIQPLWTFVVLFVFLVYWVLILAYVATLGTPTASTSKEGFERVQYVRESFPKQFWWIHVIGLIWTSEFILASQQFVIAGAVANWFFRANKKQLGCPLGGAIKNLLFHHMGSIAFGSLIITIVKIPRYILMYIQTKCEASQNACAKCCLKSCICCLWCLEKLLKFLNQNAYTIIAIEGTNFCSAAQKAFSILTSNILRVAAINSVGAFVLFLGKVGVTAGTCAIAVVWLRNLQTLHYFAIPVFFVSVFSFLIAHCFLSVYEMVVDALLMCFCVDSDINDGSPGREYYMSASLMEFVKDSSAKMEKLEKGHARNSETNPSEKTELSPARQK